MLGRRRFQAVLLFLTVFPLSLAKNNTGLTEYCWNESFEAKCGENEIILMQTAVYGRMRLGRCVPKDYGSVGCKDNVLSVLDGKCSGRTKCSFHPALDISHYTPCPDGLSSYLEASYQCVPVTQCMQSQCRAEGLLTLSSPSGYLATGEANERKCGSANCPWLLIVQKGQTLNLTVYNFHTVDEQEETFGEYCHQYATIRNKMTSLSKDITVCKNEGRSKSLLISDPGDLELTVHTRKSEEWNTQHLMHYEVTGCPDIEIPMGATIEKGGNTLTVKCTDSLQTWHLTCEGIAWKGDIGDCEEKSWSLQSVLAVSSTHHGVIAVIAIVAAFIVTVSLIVLGFVTYIKRKKLQRAYQRYSTIIRKKKPPSSSDGSNSQTSTDPSDEREAFYSAYGRHQARNNPGPTGPEELLPPPPPPPPYTMFAHHTYEIPKSDV